MAVVPWLFISMMFNGWLIPLIWHLDFFETPQSPMALIMSLASLALALTLAALTGDSQY